MVRMPGFGLDGPWRDNPAFAFVIEDAAGLTWMTGHPDAEPDLALLRGRLERRPPRALRPAPRPGAPAAHRRGRASSRRRWWTPRSTSPPSRSSSTRPTARSSSGTGTGARPPRPRTCTWPPTPTTTASATRGWPIAVATDDQWLALRDALGQPDVGDGPGAGHRDRAATRATTPSTRHLSSWCARSERPTRSSTASGRAGVPVAKVMQPHEQADAPPAAVPGLLRGGRPSGHRHRPPQHAAVPVLTRARPVPPPPGPAAGRAHRRGAARPRGVRRRAGRAARARRDRDRPRRRPPVARDRDRGRRGGPAASTAPVGSSGCPTRWSTTRSKPHGSAGSSRGGATPRPAWPRSSRSCGPSRSSSTGPPPSCARSG